MRGVLFVGAVALVAGIVGVWVVTGGSEPSDTPAAVPSATVAEEQVPDLARLPDTTGELLSALSGFIGPDELEEELRFALELFEGLDRTDEDTLNKTFVVKHRDRAEVLESQKREGFAAEFQQRHAAKDHRWTAKHPLMRVEDFTTTGMVGNARTFFGASQGGKPTGRIGEGDEPNIGGDGPKSGGAR